MANSNVYSQGQRVLCFNLHDTIILDQLPNLCVSQMVHTNHSQRALDIIEKKIIGSLNYPKSKFLLYEEGVLPLREGIFDFILIQNQFYRDTRGELNTLLLGLSSMLRPDRYLMFTFYPNQKSGLTEEYILNKMDFYGFKMQERRKIGEEFILFLRNKGNHIYT